ncbi:MAG TPA: SRPBCC domain-containing protein [Terriglobales bacterium]|jgi:uncharacterized protein YndB with AHSA1/START domain|nr:SRPBCC domain-containing protein [Terriglobales bacterium]
MAGKTATEQDRVVQEIEIAAPPERVFQALVEQDQLHVWWGAEPSVELSSFEMDARVGGRWGFECTPRAGHSHGEVGEQMRKSGANAFLAHGEILELERPRLLAYTWYANWHADAKRKTVVRWELERTKGGTRVRVTHSGLAQEAAARKDYSSGWVGVLGQLKNYMESRKV